MTPAEQREYQIHTNRLNSASSTEDEKKASRLRLDQLLWEGGEGAMQKALTDVQQRLTALEEGGVAGSSIDHAEVAKLREDVNDIIERLPTADMLAQVVEDATAAASKAAQEAAIIAVAELMGDSNPPEATQPDGPSPVVPNNPEDDTNPGS